jgi:hypothetical protein
MTLTLLSMKGSDYFWNFRAPMVGLIFMMASVFLERYIFVGLGCGIGLTLDVSVGGVAYLIGILISDRARVIYALTLLMPKLKFFSGSAS